MSLIPSPVIPMLTMEDPVREEGYMVAEGEDALSVNEMDIIRSLDRWVIFVCACNNLVTINIFP